MKPALLVWMVAPVFATACAAGPPAPLHSTLEDPAHAAAGRVSTASVAPEAESDHVRRLLQRLRSLQDSGSWGIPVRIASGPGSRVQLWAANERLFDAQSGQLRAGALQLLADLAAAVVTLDATVVHLRVDVETGGNGDDEVASLASRRAQALESVLGSYGLPENRRRALAWTAAPGRSTTRIDLVPVVRGRESLAWMTPTD